MTNRVVLEEKSEKRKQGTSVCKKKEGEKGGIRLRNKRVREGEHDRGMGD